MRPYWQSEDGMIRVFCAKYEDVLAAGVVDVPRVALIHDDPPYGIDEPTDRRGRSRPTSKWATNSVFPKIEGDDQPFDPAPLLALHRPLVTWGANHYADKLPPSPAWITWDKRDGDRSNTNSDSELAWSNIGASVRTFRHLWMGLCRASEAGDRVLAPTQKPIELCSFVYRFARLKPGDLVFVPHGGSGPDLPACRAAGLRLAWVECERSYCDTAIARLGAVTRERAAEPVGPLFAMPAQVPAS